MPTFDRLEDLPLSDDVRRANGLTTPTAQPRQPRQPRRTVAQITAEQPPALGTEAGMVALWTAAMETHGADLPAPVAEYYFFAPWRQWRFDYAWPARRVAVELDGMVYQAAGGSHNREPDRFKCNTAAAAGWRVLHFTSRALREDAAACVALLRRALEL